MRKLDWFNPHHVIQGNKKRKKASRTPGKDKGGTCVTSALMRNMCKRTRSYKHPQYDILERTIRGASKR